MVWNLHQTELVYVADIHAWRYFLVVYQRGIQHENATKLKTYAMLKKMGQLMGTFVLKKHSDLFLEEGYFDGSHSKLVRQLYLVQCKGLRQDAVPLLDDWAILDFILKAQIANFDGDIYPAYFATMNAAQKSFELTKYWLKYVAPLVNALRPEGEVVATDFIKLDNGNSEKDKREVSLVAKDTTSYIASRESRL
ncbi:acyl-Coenzyme A oxidase [Linnemannia zychae]|nr:acyl-Coenzyme A oxidase [Linnemannia zychae]